MLQKAGGFHLLTADTAKKILVQEKKNQGVLHLQAINFQIWVFKSKIQSSISTNLVSSLELRYKFPINLSNAPEKKKLMLLLSPCKPSFSTESLQGGCNLRSQCCCFEGWPSTHLSFVADDSGEVCGTDALIQTLLPENGMLASLALGLYCAAFRVLVSTKVIR